MVTISEPPPKNLDVSNRTTTSVTWSQRQPQNYVSCRSLKLAVESQRQPQSLNVSHKTSRHQKSAKESQCQPHGPSVSHKTHDSHVVSTSATELRQLQKPKVNRRVPTSATESQRQPQNLLTPKVSQRIPMSATWSQRQPQNPNDGRVVSTSTTNINVSHMALSATWPQRQP